MFFVRAGFHFKQFDEFPAQDFCDCGLLRRNRRNARIHQEKLELTSIIENKPLEIATVVFYF